MKIRLLGNITGWMVLGSLLLTCQNQSHSAPQVFQVSNQSELQQGLQRWQKSHPKSKTIYFYESMQIDSNGLYESTGIQIEKGVATSRLFKLIERNQNSGHARIIRSWSENRVQTGHNQQGARPFTMEDLYAECRQAVLSQASSKDTIEISYRGDGSLHLCQRRHPDCRDDCSIGFSVDSIVYRKLTEQEREHFLEQSFVRFK